MLVREAHTTLLLADGVGQHELIDVLAAAMIRVIADSGYRGAGCVGPALRDRERPVTDAGA